MKQTILVITIGLLLTAAAFGQEKIKEPALAQSINEMAAADQKPYEQVTRGEITALQAAADFRAVTITNLEQLKKIVQKHGYPSEKLVGKTASHNFWLMTQHSDTDTEFQKKMLRLMIKEVKRKNAAAADYAYLTDRVRINSNQPQLYGTQLVVKETAKGYELKPVFQLAKLDERRKQIGLPPIKEYLEKANKVFFEMNKDKLAK